MKRITNKILLPIILISILVFNSGILLSQETNWPPSEWAAQSFCKHIRPGEICTLNYPSSVIIFKNGDTIANCYFRDWNYNCEILPNNKFKSIVRPMSSILCIHATLIDGTNFEFRPLGKLLFRVYKRKGDVAIYDTHTDIYSSKLSFAILVINNKKVINIYPFYKLLPPKKQASWLLKFIKKRYNKEIDISYFKNQNDMIDYILDEENKRIMPKS